jgi:hypothetical protein
VKPLVLKLNIGCFGKKGQLTLEIEWIYLENGVGEMGL